MTNFTVFLVLITIVCFLLIIVIMVQNPKGGGLSSSIGGSQMLGGVQKTTDFLDKSTWTLATALIVLVLLSSLSFTGTLSDNGSKVIEEVGNAPAKTEKAATPTNSTTTNATKPAATPATPEKK
ncbi:preprotein translocase subunit SecG [Flavobacterium sp.]|uniref:preprotein translocase subunit SecG n=1 Tax=Flavobacterium sp. TaxID=239 RepID=UPI0026251C65|nr:preprotein translocase subunit SecG [Flavobacterium sp.]